MTVTTSEALTAHKNLTYIASRWTDLRARLHAGGGNALTGMPSGSNEPPLPIDVYISDLMHAIEQETRALGQVLLDETHDWAPRTSRMPVLLVDVAQRYGHWTAGDERTALAFCDWAEEYATKVARALEQPAPPDYLGPCQDKGEDGCGCGGEIYAHHDSDKARCRECGAETTRQGQLTYIGGEMEVRLMTVAEIGRALKIIEQPVPPGTLRRWASDGTLPEVEPDTGLRSFALAKRLAEARHIRRGALTG